ncbi:hypothetical protein ARMGADRAFT_1040879 [Armillaria gallica]|uniref:KEN domain-containing protein n=1 Tax=Armillaria gallica TaxID=47427 RepID=A0A2H3C8E0_ARMGA|nr:hypothetical protein ARMGADRAFT_1040879 [Armillaria gallica]
MDEENIRACFNDAAEDNTKLSCMLCELDVSIVSFKTATKKLNRDDLPYFVGILSDTYTSLQAAACGCGPTSCLQDICLNFQVHSSMDELLSLLNRKGKKNRINHLLIDVSKYLEGVKEIGQGIMASGFILNVEMRISVRGNKELKGEGDATHSQQATNGQKGKGKITGPSPASHVKIDKWDIDVETSPPQMDVINKAPQAWLQGLSRDIIRENVPDPLKHIAGPVELKKVLLQIMKEIWDHHRHGIVLDIQADKIVITSAGVLWLSNVWSYSVSRRSAEGEMAKDIQEMGHLLHCTLSNGVADKSGGLMDVEAIDLIRQMTNEDPQKCTRPNAVMCINHPFFWDLNHKLQFLQDVFDQFKVLHRNPMDTTLTMLENGKRCIIGKDWKLQLKKIFVDYMKTHWKYDGNSVIELLCAFRNNKQHYFELPDNLTKILGPILEGYLSYFMQRFPELILHVYHVISMLVLKKMPSLKPYYDELLD